MSEAEAETPTKVSGKGQAARNAAIKSLIAENQAKFDELHNAERKARGLFPVGTKIKTKAQIQAEAEKFRAALVAAGIDPDTV